MFGRFAPYANGSGVRQERGVKRREESGGVEGGRKTIPAQEPPHSTCEANVEAGLTTLGIGAGVLIGSGCGPLVAVRLTGCRYNNRKTSPRQKHEQTMTRNARERSESRHWTDTETSLGVTTSVVPTEGILLVVSGHNLPTTTT